MDTTASGALAPSVEENKSPAIRLGRGQRIFTGIFTARGLALIGLMVYFLILPVSKEFDVVAAVIAWLILFAVATLALGTAIQGMRLRRSKLASLLPPTADRGEPTVERQSSGQPVEYLLRLERNSIFPCYSLLITPTLLRGALALPSYYTSGTSTKPAFAKNSVIFPHRGVWEAEKIRFELSDRLGLSSFLWEIHESRSFKIFPPSRADSSLPILTSSNKSGDLISDIDERRGEPFDLKPYHPADGAKKIVWKVYAKTRNLLSRHPEAAMTPEGQLVIFVLAGKREDFVCSAALAYINKVADLGVDVLVGCEGWSKMTESAPAQNYNQVADLLIDAVWATDETTPATIEKDLDLLLEGAASALGSSKIERVLIFTSEERLHMDNANAVLGEKLAQLGQAPVYAIAQQQTSRGEIPVIGKSAQQVRQFFSLCSQHGWEVLREEAVL